MCPGLRHSALLCLELFSCPSLGQPRVSAPGPREPLPGTVGTGLCSLLLFLRSRFLPPGSSPHPPVPLPVPVSSPVFLTVPAQWAVPESPSQELIVQDAGPYRVLGWWKRPLEWRGVSGLGEPAFDGGFLLSRATVGKEISLIHGGMGYCCLPSGNEGRVH